MWTYPPSVIRPHHTNAPPKPNQRSFRPHGSIPKHHTSCLHPQHPTPPSMHHDDAAAAHAVAGDVRLWRSYDCIFAVVAICTNIKPTAWAAISHRRARLDAPTAAHPLSPVSHLQWAILGLAVLQLAWVTVWPRTYTMRRRTAFMVLQRALRLGMVAAVSADKQLVATIHEVLINTSQGMTPVRTALRLCLGLPMVGAVPLGRWSLPRLTLSLLRKPRCHRRQQLVLLRMSCFGGGAGICMYMCSGCVCCVAALRKLPTPTTTPPFTTVLLCAPHPPTPSLLLRGIPTDVGTRDLGGLTTDAHPPSYRCAA